MLVKSLGLQTSTTSSYDQTKTTFQGRVGSKTITDGNGAKTCLGPIPVAAMDVFDDTGTAPAQIHCSTVNNRLFIGKGVTAGVWKISYYLGTTTSGVTTWSWQGDLNLTMTNTGTYTIKGFQVDDTSSSSMIFKWGTTNTTAIQGGDYGCWGINITDFRMVSVQTFPVATAGSTNKTIYQMGDAATQATQTILTLDGVGINPGTQQYTILHGAAATPKFFAASYASSPSGTPTAGYVQITYSASTGTIAPVFAGTILLTNSVQMFTPVAQPAPNAGNNASLCVGWLTGTTIYWCKFSDITNAATSLPSLLSANLALSADFDTAATITMGQYDNTTDKWYLLTANGPFIVKQGVNNDTNGKMFGFNSYIKTELGGTLLPDFGANTAVCVTASNGFLYLTNSVAGQRNALAIDVSADLTSVTPSTGQIIASLISPVLTVNIAQGYYLAVIKQLAKRSVYPTIQWRTSGFATGPGAGFDATWTTAPLDGDLSSLANATQVQFRILFSVLNLDTTNPSQITELQLLFTGLNENSTSWAADVDNTTTGTNTPSYVAFNLVTAYASVVPNLFVRGYDSAGSLLFSGNTTSNPTLFSYSTNSGTSWNALGTIPNTVNTRARFNVVSPPSGIAYYSIRES